MAVGDNVEISIDPDGIGMIETVGPRQSVFQRPSIKSESKKQVIAANIDQLAIVVSVKEPELKPGLIDRFLIIAQRGCLRPLILFNKIDLGKTGLVSEIQNIYENMGVAFLALSGLSGENIDRLQILLKDHKTIFAGHSGVGKSTILNRLLPGLNLRIAEISNYSGKGVHTTTSVELFELPHGGFVVDSPGLKVLGLWDIKKNDIANYYPEFQKYLDSCRFAGCSHIHEPDCAVKEAVRNGEICKLRYQNYISIFNSLEDDKPY